MHISFGRKCLSQLRVLSSNADMLSQVLPVAVPALMVQSCSAPAAGLSAAVLTNPIDVVRARVQVFLKVGDALKFALMHMRTRFVDVKYKI